MEIDTHLDLLVAWLIPTLAILVGGLAIGVALAGRPWAEIRVAFFAVLGIANGLIVILGLISSAIVWLLKK